MWWAGNGDFMLTLIRMDLRLQWVVYKSTGIFYYEALVCEIAEMGKDTAKTMPIHWEILTFTQIENWKTSSRQNSMIQQHFIVMCI